MNLLCRDIRRQLSGNIWSGVDVESKIAPDCATPERTFAKQSVVFLSRAEKAERVLADPRFGMLSLFRYQLTRGREDKPCKENNTAYCSHLFSRWCALPVLVLVAQFGMYLSLVSYHMRTYEGTTCPGDSALEHKVLFASVALLYFVKSFGAWDAMVQRSHAERVAPSDSLVVVLDSFVEFGFVLVIWVTNLWIVYTEQGLLEALLNSIALEFVMELDNEFERTYFEQVPGVAADIYDFVFVPYEERPRRNCCITFLYWLLHACYLVFPAFCFVFGVVGAVCK